MPKSVYQSARALNMEVGGTAFTPAPTLYFALFTSMPSADGTGGTEVAGGAYARVAVTNNQTNFPDTSTGVKANATEILFPIASAAWGAVAGVVICDALAAGNRLRFKAFAAPVTIGIGDQYRIGIGQATFSEA